MPDKEDRQAKRKTVKSVVECWDQDGVLVRGVGRLRDVSDLGCGIETSLRLTLNQSIRLSLFSSDGKTTMDVVATVMWQREAGARKIYGLRFSSLTPAERSDLQSLFSDA